jgi:hypothetical protein
MVRADGRKIDGAAADHPLRAQSPSHLQRLYRELRRVLLIGRKVTTEVGLTVGPAETLIVRGKNVDLARRTDP